MKIWTLAESGRLQAFVSAISFNNCYYIIRRFSGRRSAEKAVLLLRDIFTPVDLTSKILNQAVDAGFSDFEDAVQFHSAVSAQAQCVITCNPDHFPRVPLSILTPAEFLSAYPFD